MFDEGPILVATAAIREDAERHVLHRAFVLDCVQKDERYLALVQGWGDCELRHLAKNARQQFAPDALSVYFTLLDECAGATTVSTPASNQHKEGYRPWFVPHRSRWRCC